MDLSGFLSAEGPRRIEWTVPLRAPNGDNAPKCKGRSKGRLRGSVAKPIAVDAEPGAKREDRVTGGDLTLPDRVLEDVCKRVKEFVPPTGYDLLPIPKNTSSLVWYTVAR